MKLNIDMTWQCAFTGQKANYALGCIKRSLTTEQGR